ncbi:MAG: Mut7-C RNAse domain-containing protein [Bacteroidota bacterium]|nr:Mut7-C RNAse domain-containing protein [Bacteroidota bacterium]
MNRISFRFYEELNNYLPDEKRKVWFEYAFPGSISMEEALHQLKIPVDEVDLILVNQQSRGFEYLLQEGDRVSVYPVFESFDISGVSKVREKPLRNPKFICDVHLGRLCKYLRMLGWDTLYSNRYTPDKIIAVSGQEGRIILSRNQLLTRHKKVTRSYWVQSSDPLEQIEDLIENLDLSNETQPLTRCLNCNHRIVPVTKQEILHRLQPRTKQYFEEFFICPVCDQIYWKGTHFEHMSDFINQIIRKHS